MNIVATDRVNITENKLLSDNWYVLRRYTYDYLGQDGRWTTQQREAYDRGNGATILLHNLQTNTVILTRQFRLPTYVNGNPSGMLIEACAGLLDNEHPDDAIRRETEEETGFRITSVEKIMEAYMSPGSVTEKLFFYLAEYSADTERTLGGGVDDEEIDLLEVSLTEAMRLVGTGDIMDGKTIMLLQYLLLRQLQN